MTPGLSLGSFFFAVFFNGSVFAQQSLTLEERLDFETGRAIFEKIWVSAPASTTASDGLGPLYNARSCAQCHKNGGRGGVEDSLVLHINDDNYGQQIQTFAIAGLAREAKLNITYSTSTVYLSEGENVVMHQPEYSLSEFGYGEMSSADYSPRIASSLAGLGLIEKIPEVMITALADENDSNNDGISGRVNWVWGNTKNQQRLGRFGWKAGQMSLAIQSAKALNLDMGISSPLYINPYGDCTNSQQACLTRAQGNSPRHNNLEASKIMMDSLLFYIRNIPAPAPAPAPGSVPAPVKSSVEKGANLFQEAACGRCHHRQYTVSNGLIEPYSDFLLHDMGAGLADKPGVDGVNSREWRTAPLWGLSLINTGFMHDGRAKTLQEAILWHDGEARDSVDRYQSMAKSERDDLIRFLNAL